MSDISDTEEERFETGKDGILFMIEATKAMFTEDDLGECAFRKCLKACDDAMMYKIKFSDADLLGVVFFGTEKTCNDGKRSHISVLRELQRPSSDAVRDLRKMHESPTMEDFKTNFGHNEDYLLADVLLLAQTMLKKSTTKLASSRILLLACSESLGKDDNHSQRQAKACARDLHGNSISLDFVPCIPGYNPSDFVTTIMQIVGGYNEPWTVPRSHVINDLDGIPNIVVSIAGSKDGFSRYAHLNFRIGAKVAIGVEIYNLIRADSGPKKGKLERSTNEKVSSKVVHQVTVVKAEVDDEDEDDDDSFVQAHAAPNATVIEGQQKVVESVDLDKCLSVAEEQVRFTQGEYGMLKRIVDPGLVLLGFVPLDFLKITHHCAPASFVYPSKTSTSGSQDLFAALWQRMGIKEVAAICSCTMRKGSFPRFAALVPSGLEKENDIIKECRKHGVQILPNPQGFHVFNFPFQDNINALQLPGRPSASSEQVSLAVSVLKKLRSAFHPSHIPNPVVESQWAAIEAIALESSEPRVVADEIKPNYEIIDERLGDLASEFIGSVYPDGYDPTAKLTKKRPAKTSKQQFDDLDLDLVEAAIKTRKVESINVDKLKWYLQTKGIPVSRKTKPTLIKEIYALRFP